MGVNVGDKIGEWKVLSERYKKESGVYYNDCECSCGIKRPVKNYLLNHRQSTSCGCLNNTGRFISKAVGDLSMSYFNSFKSSRENKGKSWNEDVTMDFLWNLFLEQDGLCALSGIPIVLNPRWSGQNHGRLSKNLQTASIDRIDNQKGYSRDNIQWVHKEVNIMRGSLTIKRFIELSKLVSIKNKKKL